MSRMDTKISVLKVIVFILPIVFILFCLALKIWSNDVYKSMIREDAIIENLTCLAYFVASVLALFIARRFFKRRRAVYAWLYMLAFLFFAVVGMEEISWGQRIFNFKTPEYLIEDNRQDEFNLHNISGAHRLTYGAYLLITLTGTCAWVVMQHRRMKTLKHKAKYFIPDWYLSSYFIFGFLIGFTLQIETYLDRFVLLYWTDMEPGELLVSLGFCLFLGITMYRQGRDHEPQSPLGAAALNPAGQWPGS